MPIPMERLILRSHELQDETLKEIWTQKDGQSFPLRIAKTAACMLLRSGRAHKYLNRCPHPDFPEYHFIGMGREQVVLRCGERVLKIVMSTDAIGEVDLLTDAAQKMQINSDKCREKLGDCWVPTDFDVVTRKTTGEEVLVARQPMVNLDYRYPTVQAMIDQQLVPQIIKREFGERIAGLNADTGLYPDLIGRFNVATTNNALGIPVFRLVDTIAVEPLGQQRFVGPDPARTMGEQIRSAVDVMINT